MEWWKLWINKTWKKKIWKNSRIVFKIFWWECLYLLGMSLTFSESKHKSSFKICSYLNAKRKKRTTFHVAYFSYFKYAPVIFYDGLSNWIVHVIWNKVTVSIFCNFKVVYNIGNENIQNLGCININFILFN